MMAGIVGHRRTFCEHDWLSATWAYRPCAVQGTKLRTRFPADNKHRLLTRTQSTSSPCTSAFCITFFAICALMWTGALFLNVYRAIVQEKTVPPRWHIYQHIAVRGFTVSLII